MHIFFKTNKVIILKSLDTFVQNGKIFTQSGVDVMITIFCDFRQFSAKKLAFFSKPNVMIKFLHYLALFWVKNANYFAKIFGENIFKNHNIGPWSHWIDVSPAKPFSLQKAFIVASSLNTVSVGDVSASLLLPIWKKNASHHQGCQIFLDTVYHKTWEKI
jgi:hypothetical protein